MKINKKQMYVGARVLAAACLLSAAGAGLPAAAQDDHDDQDHAAEALEAPDAHAGEDDDAHAGEEEGLQLTVAQRKRFGIVMQVAGPGSLGSELSLPGEIVFNEDGVVHMVPRVSGIARQVNRSVGDTVAAGDVLAVVESRELADAKSEYLAAKARTTLVESMFERESALRERQVSSEQDFLEAEQARAAAHIALRSARQKLHAIGFSNAAVAAFGEDPDEALTRFEIRAPLDGVVTEKHIALGESVDADTDIFTVVDLSSVWVNLTVYTKHLGSVTRGQAVELRIDHSGAEGLGEIAMVTPFVEASTRSATARVVLDNRDGRWIPGTFVTGFIRGAAERPPVVIAREAMQRIEDRDMVFIEHEGRFEAVPVRLGRGDRTHVEILEGLPLGSRYVAQGAFQLKATLITRTLDAHAGHGH